jgi:hypothetical protein
MNLTGRPIVQKGAARTAPALRRASRGATCTLRIPGTCAGETGTVVGCHVNMPGFSGMAAKPCDLFIIDGCAACHAVLDSRDRWAEAPLGWDDVLRALMETQQRRWDAGLIRVEDPSR